MFKGILMVFLLSATTGAWASDLLQAGMPYESAKKILMAQGWHPLQNQKIHKSSLYAQEIYDQGLQEVVDCISMELDACRFRFKKQNKVLEVKTITRQLKVDAYQTLK